MASNATTKSRADRKQSADTRSIEMRLTQAEHDRADIEVALSHLYLARQFMVAGGARKAAAVIRKAIKSAEGSKRHADLANVRILRQAAKGGAR